MGISGLSLRLENTITYRCRRSHLALCYFPQNRNLFFVEHLNDEHYQQRSQLSIRVVWVDSMKHHPLKLFILQAQTIVSCQQIVQQLFGATLI